MQAYFIKLFGYDTYANEVMIHATQTAGSPGKTVMLLSHVLSASQVWLSRCRGETHNSASLLWKELPIDTLSEINTLNHAR